MDKYRFLGDWAEVTGIGRLIRFGQEIELTEEVAKQALSENLQIIPEEMFEAFGFTDEELKKYPNAIQQNRAPADFLEKKTKALIALHEYQQSVLSDKQ